MDNNNELFPRTKINWYPGHMAKTKRQIIEDLKLIDVIVEILDARNPISSQNPDIIEYTKNKPKVIVLNKSDLADEEQNVKWVQYFKQKGIVSVLVNSNSGKGIQETISNIEKVYKSVQGTYEEK